ncbi:ebf75c10-e208-41cd-b3a7-69c08196dc13 [Thermothielavioides terrestris]|uniref:Ebf75c10-e208-41cd-b3a7-69c08196dc13 n=1 Tax=Thermothielavioides terrestris TaxID=2587410 RepID=A0A3S5CX93_9PEZI|nr:ebf75c10-e208-41cd-b3a7-69c08196dc13 [Thermothielavioides terrestris]
MAPTLATLPPELLMEIAECEPLDLASLSALIRVERYFYHLLWPVLYRRSPKSFFHCIRTGSVAGVSKFIAAGADVNAKIDLYPDIQDFFGPTTPLMTAAVRNRGEVVDLLLRAGADIALSTPVFLSRTILADNIHPCASIAEHNAFTVALALGYDGVALQLAKAMADPDSVVAATIADKWTALELAVLCLRPKIVRQLLASGARPNRQRPRGEGAPLHILMANYSSNERVGWAPNGAAAFTSVVMALLEYGADPFIKRQCWAHKDDPDSEECRKHCVVVPCTAGACSPYPQVRKHFRDLAHRQLCPKLACKASRHQQ